MASLSQWVRKLGSNMNLPRVFNQLWQIDDIKCGKCVGQDQFGNKYYEDEKEIFGRHRHVEYANWDYNATQVPPQWRQWLHGTYQDPPPSNCNDTVLKWVNVKALENPTGTPQAYKPYSTTKSKMQSWEPQVKERI